MWLGARARVGQILDALKKKSGKEEDTIVIFTSSNGRQPGQQGPNDGLLSMGHKWQSLEGGTLAMLSVTPPISRNNQPTIPTYRLP